MRTHTTKRTMMKHLWALLVFSSANLTVFVRAQTLSTTQTQGNTQSLALTSFREQEPCFENNPDYTYFCPTNRYCQWMDNVVSNREIFKDQLGYARREWDYLKRVNEELEYKSWSELNENQTVALSFIGFTADSHDCCHGHYISHEWSDFENEDQYADVKAAWELMGYNEANWGSIDLQNLLPPYGTMLWDDLPNEVRSAAADDLCYNKELWDDITLNSWTNTTVIPGTFQVTSSGRFIGIAGLDADGLASLNENIVDIIVPPASTSSPTESQIVTTSPTPQPTDAPTDTPTDTPTKLPTTSPTNLVVDIPVTSPPPTNAITPAPTPAPTPNPTPTPISTPLPTPFPTPMPTTTPVTSMPTSLPGAEDGSPTDVLTFEVEEQPPCKELNPDTLYFCPPSRYCVWDYYVESTQQLLSSELNYTRDSWNYELDQLNDLEYVKFTQLTDRQQKALIAMGHTEQTHDCCHSHFTTYSWEELFTPELSVVVTSLTLLGYTEATWELQPTPLDRFRSPLYLDSNWDDLPRRVKFGARSLCYTRELWDRIPMTVWSVGAITPGSNEREQDAIPPSQPPPPPPPTPSVMLASQPSSRPTVTPLPVTCRELDNENFDYKCPVQRYCEWDYYEPTARQFLQFQVGYDRVSWNYESGISSTHPLELTPFEDLSKSIQDGLLIFFDGMEYTADTHDCCLGHYTGYDWDELDIVKPNIKEAWEVLGYDESSWTGITSPQYAGVRWEDLPSDVQTVATKFLCYSKETWDGAPLPTWSDDIMLPGQFDPNDIREDDIIDPSAPIVEVEEKEDIDFTIASCRPLDPTMNYFCPTIRYCEWDSFDLGTKQALMFQVGYTEPDWNYEGRNPLEDQSFANVNIFVKNGLRDIGFDADSHNCCLNHYTDFKWEDFENTNSLKNVLETYQKLGYTKDIWESNESVALEEVIWDELPKDIQTDLFDHLCYTEEVWDGVTLDEWPEDVILPGSSSKIDPETITSSSSVSRWTPSWLFLLVSQLGVGSILLSSFS